jgi:lipopolysaccharide/colanic/teichoic acid biosynthesis glycosyltransferase
VSRRLQLGVKWLFDRVGSALLLVLLSPLFVGLAAWIILESGRPVFLVQQRVLRGGRPFGLFKFRTMVPDALEAGKRMGLADPFGVLANDPRITRSGRWLRRTSLDELPQLWSVLKGDMSLVGPRPLVEDEDRQITGWGRGRLDLTPGLTGLWQVLGRTSIPFEEMVKLDYVYVTNWSLWWDIKILVQTLPVVLNRKGAY